MNRYPSSLKELEFNCMLAITGDAFDINNFLDDFIKGQKMNDEQYYYLLAAARDLLQNVKTLKVCLNRCRFDLE